jgi:hypothetical protein
MTLVHIELVVGHRLRLEPGLRDHKALYPWINSGEHVLGDRH